MPHTALVLFSARPPEQPPAWWQQFAVLIGPQELASCAVEHGVAFEALESWVDPGSVEEAAAFLEQLARATLSDGARISKSVMYKGYELWWTHYDDLYYQQCLPFIRYRRLLERLRALSHVTLHAPPATGLFRAYLEAHSVAHAIVEPPRKFPSAGTWLQIALTLISLPFLASMRPRILLYTGDRFDPPRDHSFRMHLVYEELRRRKLPFVEYIRSMESARVVLTHAIDRRRPVVYSYAVKTVLYWVASLFGEKTFPTHSPDPETVFVRTLSVMYLRNVRGTVWSMNVMRFFLRVSGVRAAFIAAASSRTFHEVFACKLEGIPTIGILHGASSRFYNVYDFMPEYDGEKHLPLDTYGIWSEGWRDYYVKHSAIYRQEHLPVSGPMRPLPPVHAKQKTFSKSPGGPLKVLLVPGELSDPQEIMRYARHLMREPGVSLHLTFRPYRDAFENWIRKHDPQFLEQLGAERIFRGRSISEDIAACDVVIGTYSTAVLEALQQLKPIVFFKTAKWGDYFDLRGHPSPHAFFAENPEALVELIRTSKEVPAAELMKLQERFFGDPFKNGSAWVVDQLELWIH